MLGCRYREHHGPRVAEEDPILFVESTRDEPPGMLAQLRQQYDDGVALGGDLAATLEIHFRDENSAGSAVRREWFSLASDAFLAPTARLLTSTDKGKTVRPLPMAADDPGYARQLNDLETPCSLPGHTPLLSPHHPPLDARRYARQLKDLEMLGRFLGLALVQQVRPLPRPLLLLSSRPL